MMNVEMQDHCIYKDGYIYKIESYEQVSDIYVDIYSADDNGYRYDTTFGVDQVSINDVVQRTMTQLLDTLARGY